MKPAKWLAPLRKDRRSGRMVVVIECILNQNARDRGAATHSGMNTEIMDIFRKYNVGAIQMPCPEMACLGLLRQRPKGVSIREILDTPEGRRCCRRLSVPVADRIQEFLENDYEVVAILGGDVHSPGCAVHHSDQAGTAHVLTDRSGVFLRALEAELEMREIHIPFRGVRESNRRLLDDDLAWLENALAVK